MDRNKVFETVKGLLLNQLTIDPENVTETALVVDDLGADSANVMMLIMDLEAEFDMTVADDDIASVRTVGDIVDCIMKKA